MRNASREADLFPAMLLIFNLTSYAASIVSILTCMYNNLGHMNYNFKVVEYAYVVLMLNIFLYGYIPVVVYLIGGI